jgi:hypothetical protein
MLYALCFPFPYCPQPQPLLLCYSLTLSSLTLSYTHANTHTRTQKHIHTHTSPQDVYYSSKRRAFCMSICWPFSMTVWKQVCNMYHNNRHNTVYTHYNTYDAYTYPYPILCCISCIYDIHLITHTPYYTYTLLHITHTPITHTHLITHTHTYTLLHTPYYIHLSVAHLLPYVYVTCITIIDTIIHHILYIHTNDAYTPILFYTHMTYTSQWHICCPTCTVRGTRTCCCGAVWGMI